LLLVNLTPCVGLDLSVYYCLFQPRFSLCILSGLHAHRTTVVLSPKGRRRRFTSADYSVDLPSGYRSPLAFKRPFVFQFMCPDATYLS
jgi:hypothetical protein